MHSAMRIISRKIATSARQFGAHGGTPGENLPFSLDSKVRITAYCVLFFGSGIAAPFLILRHQLLKK